MKVNKFAEIKEIEGNEIKVFCFCDSECPYRIVNREMDTDSWPYEDDEGDCQYSYYEEIWCKKFSERLYDCYEFSGRVFCCSKCNKRYPPKVSLITIEGDEVVSDRWRIENDI